MRIKSIRLKAIGPFEDACLEFPERSDPTLADVHLLVGPNGSGKSTILRVLAQSLTSEYAVASHLHHNDDSLAMVATSAGDIQQSLQSPDGFGGGAKLQGGRGRWIDSRASKSLFQQLSSRIRRTSDLAVEWEAFAFSGHRSLSESNDHLVDDRPWDPWKGALSPNRVDGQSIAQWVLNTKARQGIALAQGEPGEANEELRSISMVETTLSSMMDAHVQFSIQRNPLGVKVLIDGAPNPIGFLPDGYQATLSWVGDLLMRVERVKWANSGSLETRKLILFLDEVAVHLHPAAQRRVLPTIQRLFPSAQIFAATHSPFVVASAYDATVHVLTLKDGRASVGEYLESQAGHSYSEVLGAVFNASERYDQVTEDDLHELITLSQGLKNGDPAKRSRAEALMDTLSARSPELADRVRLFRATMGSSGEQS